MAVPSARSRSVAERAMTGLCDITRAGTGTGTLNVTTGAVTGPAATVIASGVPCRVDAPQRSDQVTSAGEQLVSQRDVIVAIPLSAPAVKIDDIVTLTASDRDPQLVTRRLRVRDIARGTRVVQRELYCVDDLEQV